MMTIRELIETLQRIVAAPETVANLDSLVTLEMGKSEKTLFHFTSITSNEALDKNGKLSAFVGLVATPVGYIQLNPAPNVEFVDMTQQPS